MPSLVALLAPPPPTFRCFVSGEHFPPLRWAPCCMSGLVQPGKRGTNLGVKSPRRGKSLGPGPWGQAYKLRGRPKTSSRSFPLAVKSAGDPEVDAGVGYRNNAVARGSPSGSPGAMPRPCCRLPHDSGHTQPIKPVLESTTIAERLQPQ